mgnify:CR=1 FL=1
MNNGRGGVTWPDGFTAAGTSCGIKAGGHDLAIVYSREPCVAAGCFTTNQFKAHSVVYTRRRIRNAVHAIVVNSGNANACNGPENYRATEDLAVRAAEILGVPPGSVLMASTGIIGGPLPAERIAAALPALVGMLSPAGHEDAVRGIMTTDTKKKEIHLDTEIAGRRKQVAIGAMAKGAGMICPTMATMLCFITTDAVISRDALQSALSAAVADSFNMITVDNDMSTNDMVVCLANGAARNPRIRKDSDSYPVFASALKRVCVELAVMIASDGEGATKLIRVEVTGAWSDADARRVARKIAGSNLCKSAIGGCWPNAGRILAAAGATSAKMDVSRVKLSMCGIPVYDGRPVPHDEAKLRKLLGQREVVLAIDLGRGTRAATAWGCDLTEEYVAINREE